MALSENSYSSVTQVTAFTRHLLDGETSFNANTRPDLGDVETFINQLSGLLNTQLAKHGITVPVTQVDAKHSLDAWVTSKAAAWVEMTQRAAGFSDDGNERAPSLYNLMPDVVEFVEDNYPGWIKLGAGATPTLSIGAEYTGLKKNSERPDVTNTTREQPLFKRRQFDRGGAA